MLSSRESLATDIESATLLSPSGQLLLLNVFVVVVVVVMGQDFALC